MVVSMLMRSFNPQTFAWDTKTPLSLGNFIDINLHSTKSKISTTSNLGLEPQFFIFRLIIFMSNLWKLRYRKKVLENSFLRNSILEF